MVLRGKPNDIDDYIIVDSTNSLKLHSAGFYPKYFDGNYIYYQKNSDILTFIKEYDISCIKG